MRNISTGETGGGTPPEPAAATAALQDSCNHNPLVAGFHFRGVLPHLKKEGGTYFVTFRQASALPKEVLLRFKHERDAILQQALAAKRPLTWHEQEELFRWYSSRVDKYLDAGHGTCHLSNPELASLVAGAVQFFDGQRYELCAWVVMPNHVHLLILPRVPVPTITRWLKSWTARQANEMLGQAGRPFWQDESYNHWARDRPERERIARYIEQNPVSAGLAASPEEWAWSSAGGQAAPPAPPSEQQPR